MSVPPAAPALLVAHGLRLDTASKTLLVDASFSLHAGGRAALVAGNGCGKSSLLSLIAARAGAQPDPAHLRVSGRLELLARLRVGQLRQHPGLGDTRAPASAWLAAAAGEVAELGDRHRDLVERLAAKGSDPALLEEYGAVSERLDALAGWDWEERREVVLAGLGLDPGVLGRRLGALSGGQAARLALAGLLLGGHQLLVLDEPTNDLDASGIEFLSGWLRSAGAGVLLVSHDRDLLDLVVDLVLVIEEEGQRLSAYSGGYSAAVVRRAEELAARLRAYEEQERRRAALLQSASDLGQRAQGFEARSHSDFHRARGKRVARRAQSQVHRVERELEALALPQPQRPPRFDVRSPAAGRGSVLTVRGLRVGYDAAAPLVSGLDLRLRRGGRLAITGANGSGKTTLLRVLCGELPPLRGSAELASPLRLGVLRQDLAADAATTSVVEHARRLAPAAIGEEEMRVVLGRAVLEDVSRLSLGRLSPGQRRRVELAALLASACDLLVLDEPTNHLDLLTIEMLEQALGGFSGAVVAVSHDRRLLRTLAVDQTVTLDAPPSGSAAPTARDAG